MLCRLHLIYYHWIVLYWIELYYSIMDWSFIGQPLPDILSPYFFIILLNNVINYCHISKRDMACTCTELNQTKLTNTDKKLSSNKSKNPTLSKRDFHCWDKHLCKTEKEGERNKHRDITEKKMSQPKMNLCSLLFFNNINHTTSAHCHLRPLELQEGHQCSPAPRSLLPLREQRRLGMSSPSPLCSSQSTQKTIISSHKVLPWCLPHISIWFWQLRTSCRAKLALFQICHTNILWQVSWSQTKWVRGVPPRFHISLQDVLDTLNPQHVTHKFALDFLNTSVFPSSVGLHP